MQLSDFKLSGKYRPRLLWTVLAALLLVSIVPVALYHREVLRLSQEKLEEFVKEASTAHRLKHAHIISLLAFGLSADSIPYLVMDYAPNGTLSKRYPKGTQLSLDTIIGYLLPLA